MSTVFGQLRGGYHGAALWDDAQLTTVRHVLSALKRPAAYTTVMTVTENRHWKGRDPQTPRKGVSLPARVESGGIHRAAHA